MIEGWRSRVAPNVEAMVCIDGVGQSVEMRFERRCREAGVYAIIGKMGGAKGRLQVQVSQSTRF